MLWFTRYIGNRHKTIITLPLSFCSRLHRNISRDVQMHFWWPVCEFHMIIVQSNLFLTQTCTRVISSFYSRKELKYTKLRNDLCLVWLWFADLKETKQPWFWNMDPFSCLCTPTCNWANLYHNVCGASVSTRCRSK